MEVVNNVVGIWVAVMSFVLSVVASALYTIIVAVGLLFSRWQAS